MNINPNVSEAVADATSFLGWVKAQATTLIAAHKTAAIVVFACGFISGCVLT